MPVVQSPKVAATHLAKMMKKSRERETRHLLGEVSVGFGCDVGVTAFGCDVGVAAFGCDVGVTVFGCDVGLS